jgi:hypothetical protein
MILCLESLHPKIPHHFAENEKKVIIFNTANKSRASTAMPKYCKSKLGRDKSQRNPPNIRQLPKQVVARVLRNIAARPKFQPLFGGAFVRFTLPPQAHQLSRQPREAAQ